MLGRFRKRREQRVFVIGLDCGAPELMFDRWRDRLPSFRRLMEKGLYGDLMSTIPCITVPAWSSMLSSKDPGTLGFYGFRNRADRSYERMTIATSADVKERRVWDYVGAAGKRSVIVGVPQTYPVRPLEGWLVSSFLTPSTTNPQTQWTYPAELREEVRQLLGDQAYDVDVPQFRTDDKDFLLQQIYTMTDKRFQVLDYLLREKPWDFFMFVEMGVDRMHHAFWSYMDAAHPRYVAGNPYENAILDYMVHLDTLVGGLLEQLDDDTVLMVVSDHGAKAMQGGICINEWMRREGYLVLLDEPRGENVVPFEKAEVDWSRTRAWGAGGYYGRIFMNVQGREPQGIIPPSDYERERDRLITGLAAIPAPDGTPMHTVSYKPEQVYRTVRNIPPDLITYFGDLRWRSVGSFGHGGIYTFENDIGPDDANHAPNGMFILFEPRKDYGGLRLGARHLMDVAPTILDSMGLPVSGDMQGKVISREA
jgi:predicted AlkP superfamily phosphohydrolase/phosphomutase